MDRRVTDVGARLDTLITHSWAPTAVTGRGPGDATAMLDPAGVESRGRPRRVVVTGGAGFLGSHVCERLVDDGFDVVCVDDFSTGRPENVAGLTEKQSFSLMVANVSERLEIDGPVGYVMHLASPASPVDYLRMPIHTLQVGSRGTENALQLAQIKNARLLLASTSEIYGDPELHPQPESYFGNVNPIGPRSVYNEAKRYAEAITAAYRRTCGVDTAIARIFNTFGPRMRIDDGRVVAQFIRQTLHSEALSIFGDGTQTRTLCYVDDMVDGLIALLLSDLSGPVNLGGSQELSVIEIAELVGLVLERRVRLSLERPRADEPQRRRPDLSLAQRALRWSPQVPLQTGIAWTVEWFRDVMASNDDRRCSATRSPLVASQAKGAFS